MINELFDSETKLKKMRESAEGLAKPDSAYDTASLALEK